MKVLRHPQEVAQMPFSRGIIYATPPGDCNSFKSHSLYIKNIEGGVSQRIVSADEKQPKGSHPCTLPMLPGRDPGPLDNESVAHMGRITEKEVGVSCFMTPSKRLLNANLLIMNRL